MAAKPASAIRPSAVTIDDPLLKHGAADIADGLVEQLFATENDCLTTKQVNPGPAPIPRN